MKRAGRAEARKRWAQVAAGQLDDPATRDWLQTVAAAILRADDEPDPTGKERPGRIVTAAGLAGRKKDTGVDAAALVALDRMQAEPGGNAAARTLAMIATRDPRWQDPHHRTAREALLVAIAHMSGMAIVLADTTDGRDTIAARIRAARREP